MLTITKRYKRVRNKMIVINSKIHFLPLLFITNYSLLIINASFLALLRLYING